MMKVLAENQDLYPMLIEPGDTLLVTYRDRLGQESLLVDASPEEAMTINYVAALELDETDLRAIGLPSLDKGLVGLFGQRGKQKEH